MKKTKEKIKFSSKGVTLIALIITIIILLIIAGISIATLIGENGLLQKAETAKRNAKISEYEEEIKLEIIDEQAERKYQEKEEVMIVSLQERLEKKDWKKQVRLSDENMVEQIEKEKNTRITIDTIDDYQLIINVDNLKNIATIKNSINTEEKEETVSKEEYDKLQNRYHELSEKYDLLQKEYEDSKQSTDYDDKPYIQTGLNIYDGRVRDVQGGYYEDSEGITWVNITFTTSKFLARNDSWLLIYPFPKVKERIIVTDTNRKYAFSLETTGHFHFFDHRGFDMSANTTYTVQFKY